jgi:hypothetical protein
LKSLAKQWAEEAAREVEMKHFVAMAWLMLAGVLMGCGLFGTDEEGSASAVSPPPVAPPQAGPPGLPLPPAPPAVGSALGEFAWTETPAFNMIPTTPASGTVNNQPFAVAAAVIEPGVEPESWRLVLLEKPLETPTSPILEQQFLSIDLPSAPTMGSSWIRPMEYGKGHWQVNLAGTPEQQTAWNAENAWVAEITRWDVRDYDRAAGGAQAVGTASLKLAVCYKGSGSFTNSFVAGVIDNVVVRHLSPPSTQPKASSGRSGSKSGAGSAKSGGSSIPSNIGGGNISPEEARRLADEAAKKAQDEANKRGIKIMPIKVKPIVPASKKESGSAK